MERRKEPGLENDLSHGQLQGLLMTIGLTLGEEELGRLTDRNQERMFGWKEEKERLMWDGSRAKSPPWGSGKRWGLVEEGVGGGGVGG